MTKIAVVALTFSILGLLKGGMTPAVAQQAPVVTGYWHTDGTRIVDAAGNLVRIAGVTWYGMDDNAWVPAGLNYQRYTTIMDLVKLLGYNTIRLPFSNQLVEQDPIVTREVDANPQFRGLHALQVMDAIVNYARQIGLKIILDDHRSRAAPPMQVNSLYPPLWFTRRYPISAWIRDWQTLAYRYQGNDAVIGFDLRNEPHPSGPGPWNLQAYLERGPTWGPYHGVEHAATDWRLAAEQAGNAVLAINPHLLIIVQGLAVYPDEQITGGVASSWWAGLLTPVKEYPVVLQVPHQLVYSVHEWGPRKHLMPWYQNMTPQSVREAWYEHWSFVLNHPNAPYAAPILLGEFGTCTDDDSCVSSQQAGSQGAWFGMMLRFLRRHPQVGWSFYAINGTNSNDCQTDNGVLNAAWNSVANLSLQAHLASIQPVPGLVPLSTTEPIIPGTETTRAPRSATSPLCQLP